jgi:hypothetical protein
VSDTVLNDLAIVDNVFVKMMKFLEIGDSIEGHAHAFDHITLLATGAVLMEHDNGSRKFKAPHLIVTPKGIVHKFIATEPNTVLACIHAIRDGDDVDDIIDPHSDTETAWNAITQHPLISISKNSQDIEKNDN